MNPIPIIMRLTGLGKVGSTIALIALVLTLLGVGKCAYDASVVKDYEAEVQADVIDATSEASAEADAAAAEYAAQFGKQQEAARKEIDNAQILGNSPFDSWNDDSVQQPAGQDRKAAR